MKVVKQFRIILGKGKKRRSVSVGDLTDTGVFIKYVRSSIHFLRKYKAYGISLEVYDELKKTNCNVVEIYDGDNVEKWSAPFNLFKQIGWNWSYGGYEMQRFLEKKWWDIYDENGSRLQKGRREKYLKVDEYSPQQTLI